MKKAVFFGVTGQNSINKVFSPEIMEKLSQMLDIHNVVIDRENLDENSIFLKSAEFAFSTWGMPSFTEEEIARFMPKLKVLFYAAGSVQYFARPFLNNNVKVLSAWAANGVPVAQYSVAQIILANKGFYQSSLKMKQEPQAAQNFFNTLPGNYNVKVGLLGIGQIGSLVAEMLKPYGLEVLAYDPFLSDQKAEMLGIIKTSLKDIFSTCQTISNHMANLPETVGVLNRELFDTMLENATFINTGRGAQVVEEDLAHALKEIPTRTAVLDVTINEPLEEESPLLSLENVILTPHIAGSSGNEVVRMAQYMLEEFRRFENGEPFRYEVTLEMLKTMA